MGRRLDPGGAALTTTAGLPPTATAAPPVRGARPHDRRRVTPPRALWFGLLPLAFLGVFFAWPLVTVLARSVDPSALDVLTSAQTWRVAGFTAVQAVLSTALTLLLGIPAAYVLHRMRIPGRRGLLALMTVPFVLPTIVVGAAFRALLPSGWTGTLAAILAAHVFFNLAVVIRVVGGLWAHLDPRQEEAARTLGAGPVRVFRTVTWPLLRPAVLASAALVFLFTFTSFGVVLTLGGPTTATLEVEIYRRTVQLFDLPGAAALCLLQVLAVGLVLVVAAVLQRRLSVRQRWARADAVLHRPRTWGDRLLVLLVLLEAAYVVAPMVALAVRSLRVGDGWGLDWWAALTTAGPTTRDVAAWDSARVSLTYALVTVVLAVVIGGAAASAIAYARRGSDALGSAVLLPLGTSAVTLGFGLLITFSRAPVDLRGSALIVPIGHALIAVPLVVATVLPVLRSVDPRLREVAATLGAPPGRTWRTVDLPALARALGIGAGFATAVSLGEFGATSFLARSDTPTLPVQIGALLSRPGEANAGQAAALAVVLVLVTAALVLATERLRGRPSGGL
ncbi:MAG: iron ABC transporter permease [Candidatus Nanopelagicales bacterium]